LRVAAAFVAERERAAAGRFAAARPPMRPPLRAEAWLTALPRPEPLFLPPPVSLLTVAQARRSASLQRRRALVAFLDVFGLALLLAGVARFVAAGHSQLLCEHRKI
jgi:hypothetical protein